MGRPGRPTVGIELSEDEQETLQRWARRHSSAQALALRCRIVLAVAEGGTDTEIAGRLGVNRVTVGKWRHRFAEDRLEGLGDGPRPGAARRSVTTWSRRSWWRRWRPRRRTRPTGRPGRWPSGTGSVGRPCQ